MDILTTGGIGPWINLKWKMNRRAGRGSIAAQAQGAWSGDGRFGISPRRRFLASRNSSTTS
jgi:hypothetical protein